MGSEKAPPDAELAWRQGLEALRRALAPLLLVGLAVALEAPLAPRGSLSGALAPWHGSRAGQARLT
eukprot:14594533-Heterocapsa_arctica.AAC.1